MAPYTTATASQAWAVLSRHAREDIASLRLQELCRDNDRVASLVAVYNTTFEQTITTNSDSSAAAMENRMLIVDLSRQLMTTETLSHLFKLTAAKKLRKYITQLAWGQNNPLRPTLPSRARQGEQQPLEHQDDRSTFSHLGDNDIQTVSTFETVQTVSPIMRSTTTAGKPGLPSMHFALRVPANQGYEMVLPDGTNALTGIHQDWRRIQLLSDAIRRGQLRGATGSMLRDVVMVGRGVPVEALKFVYHALLLDEQAVFASKLGLEDTSAAARIRQNLTGNSGPASVTPRRLRFIGTVDPVSTAAAVSDLDPATTLVVSVALCGNEETGLTTKLLKSWLLQTIGGNRRPEHVLAKHMLLVTGNDHVASAINKPESVHVIPDHSRCEAFSTFTAATLLPLSIVYGWPIVQMFLAGGHDMDNHFVDAGPRHNLPILLALTDVWNDILLGASSRVVSPFAEALNNYPEFVAALEAQTCSKTLPRSVSSSLRREKCSSFVINGRNNGLFDRASYQSETVVNTEAVALLDPQVRFNTSRSISASMDDIWATQDASICSVFSHCDELAFGSEHTENNPPHARPLGGEYQHLYSDGNRPSTLLVCGKLDAFSCGQLVALAEHRAVVKAHLWSLDAFVREVGSSLHTFRSDLVRDELRFMFSKDPGEDDDDDEAADGPLILSTKTILSHYAKQMNAVRR